MVEKQVFPSPSFLHLHLDQAELNLLLECIESQISNVAADKNFAELIKNTLEKIRKTIHAAVDTNSNTDPDEEQNENNPPEEEVEKTDEATEKEEEVKQAPQVRQEPPAKQKKGKKGQ